LHPQLAPRGSRRTWPKLESRCLEQTGPAREKRRVLGEQEIAGVQAADTHVLQDDGVARVNVMTVSLPT
jgi:hypothetical protein